MLTQFGRWSVRYSTPLRISCTRKYFSRVNVLDDLAQRGFIHHVTRLEALRDVVQAVPQVVYSGIDPTAKSLHIGHLVPLMCLLHFQIRGHTIIPLIGGATGRIGDPSGRLTERPHAVVEQVEGNARHLTEGLEQFFQRALHYAGSRLDGRNVIGSRTTVANNVHWHQKMTMLDFLQHVGVHARVNTMLNRESVRTRLDSQQGLSFTEFTYQLLQAYDFYYLNKHYKCAIQVGGSDQLGNILAGIELIGRLDRGCKESVSDINVFAITTPLLTTSTGQKFGKSAGNALWLDPGLTSVLDFYQYWMKVADADVEKYLRLFTLLSMSEISDIMKRHHESPEKRIAQRKLASEVTEVVHSREDVARAEALTAMLFDSNYTQLTADQVLRTLENDPRLVSIDRQELLGTPVIKLASKYRLVASTSVARALVNSRGLYVNNETLPDVLFKIPEHDLIDNRAAIVRAGKDKHLVLVAST